MLLLQSINNCPLSRSMSKYLIKLKNITDQALYRKLFDRYNADPFDRAISDLMEVVVKHEKPGEVGNYIVKSVESILNPRKEKPSTRNMSIDLILLKYAVDKLGSEKSSVYR